MQRPQRSTSVVADAGLEAALLPTHYFTAHQSAIRSLAWIRAPVVSASGEVTADDPTVIASGGYDGVECLTDIRDMCGNVINRTRGECAPFIVRGHFEI